MHGGGGGGGAEYLRVCVRMHAILSDIYEFVYVTVRARDHVRVCVYARDLIRHL